MDLKIKLLYFAVDLLVPISLGYLFSRKGWFSEKFFNSMVNYNMLLLYPLLSILSFWVLPFSLELLWLPVFGVLLCLIPGVIAYFTVKNKFSNMNDTGSYIISAILSNLGTLGGLCVFILYGETGFAYTQLVVLLQVVVIFLICYPLASYYHHSGQNANTPLPYSQLFLNRNQLPVVGFGIGFLLYYLNIPRPAILGDIFNPLVHISAWTALIPVGHSIKFSAIHKYYSSTLDLVPIKFIATPLLTYVIAQLVFTDPIVIHSVLILACMPTAISAVMVVKIHDLNIHIANASFILTTALFLVVMYPLIFFVLH